jgi:tetratricopeptide (TPR) repeat protein
LEDYPKVREILELLVTNWPKKEYLTQLAAIYGELDQEKKQLQAYEAAHAAGWLDRGAELIQLSQLFLQAEVPFKAAKIVEAGLEAGTIDATANNWRLLSQAWTLAQEDEKAIPALKKAAGLSNDGILDIRLAQAYLNLDQYEPCVKSARDGLKKGDLRRTDSANVVLGMCLYDLKRYNEAKAAFRTAAQDRRSAKAANQWIDFINKEIERENQLRDAMKPLTASN